MNSDKKLSTEAYKGVRDFFPADMAVQNHIFKIWRSIVEKFGYQEYSASVLEPSELYKAKSGEEIVNEQTYTFKDRGDREVTLRPEMTPTLARMVAAKKRELGFPLRWYSIPNLFRYEQPQRGRLREHWQLNVDIFGIQSIQAEVEAIQIGVDIVRALGLKDTDFEVRINNRKLMNYLMDTVLNVSAVQAHAISKVIDRMHKMPAEDFKKSISEIIKDDAVTQKLTTLLHSKNFKEFVSHLPQTASEQEGVTEIHAVIEALEKLGITNAVFDQSLMRGFDYYTGIVFEVFDKNPKNRRAVLGGGRYDDLLSLFGGEKVPAVGFGMGDVVVRDLLETYSSPSDESSPADLGLAVMSKECFGYANDLAQKLRSQGLRVTVDYTEKKIGDQIKNADKLKIPAVICIGDEEVATGNLKLKKLKSGEEVSLKDTQIKEILSK